MQIRVLFLDDRTKRIEAALKRFTRETYELTIVTNVLECLRALAKNDFDYVYLDHDLGGRDFVDPNSPESGMQVVRYIYKTGWPEERVKPTFVIHSSNVFAATLMKNELTDLDFSCRVEPFLYDKP